MDEQSIFLEALEKDSSEAQALWLVEACGADDQLKSRIQALLQRHAEANSFLEKPAPGLEATILPENSRGNLAESLEAGLAASFGKEEAVVIGRSDHSVLKTLGQTIDLPRVALRESMEEGDDSIVRPNSAEMPTTNSDSRYQLQGEIARGGMGAIIKGRDTDLGRDLAIKVLLDDHKDKPEIVQRFVEEAQIGGQLQHPGIAPVYELGQFADHRPFFSMKLVKGKTLSALMSEREDAFADRGKLLGIFEQMCQTMAYAHSRGVIHRDLKPANIMIGAFGEVQVMDWGLAKVLPVGGVADEKKAHTKLNDVSIIQTLRSVGSDAPGMFGSQGSDTQMGSVMGTPAYMPPEQALGEIDNLDERADVFGLGAILCEILTGQPPYVGSDGNSIYRQAARGKLGDCFERLDSSEADAELIALTKSCLELEPEDRPRDAGVLAEQVAHYLESVENKLRETERAKADAKIRYKMAFYAGSAIVTVLIIGISASLWQAVRATTAEMKTAETLVEVSAQRDAKELARKEAEEVSNFLTDLLQSPDPAQNGHMVTVAEMLDMATENLETNLSDQPAQRAKLQATLAETYKALGLNEQAVPLREQVRDYYLTTLGPEHPDTLKASSKLATSYFFTGRGSDASKMHTEVLNLSLKVLGPEHPETLKAKDSVAWFYFFTGRRDDALEMREETLKLSRKVNGPEHPDTLNALNSLAFSYNKAGRKDDALKIQEEVLDVRRKTLGLEHPDTLKAFSTLAGSYKDAGRVEEALKMREEAVLRRSEVLGPEHPGTLNAMEKLALSYVKAGRLDEALKLREDKLALRLKVSGPEHRGTLGSMLNLADSYVGLGRLDEALEKREEVLRIRDKVLGSEHPATLSAMFFISNSYAEVGRHEEALKKREEALKLQIKVMGPEHSDTLWTMYVLAHSYFKADRLDEALVMRKEVLRLRRKVLGLEDSNTLNSMNDLADSYANADRLEEAMSLWKEHFEIKPNATFAAMKIATLQVWLNKDTEYQATCERMLKWAQESTKPDAFERVSKLSCLRPIGDDTTRGSVLALAQRAVEVGPENEGLLPWSRMSLGMAEFRSGNYTKADDALKTAVETASDTNDDSQRDRIESISNFYRTMSLYQQGKADEARTLFTEAEATMKPLPADEKNPLADKANHDDLIMWLAYKEAKALLAETGSSDKGSNDSKNDE